MIKIEKSEWNLKELYSHIEVLYKEYGDCQVVQFCTYSKPYNEVGKEDLLGKIFKSNNDGEYRVIEYISTKNITIQFLDTGNIQSGQKQVVMHGMMKDRKKEQLRVAEKLRIKKEIQQEAALKLKELKRLSEEIKHAEKMERKRLRREKLEAERAGKPVVKKITDVGNTFSTRNSGDFVIVRRINNRTVEIKFIDTGHLQEVRTNTLTCGGVSDKSLFPEKYLTTQRAKSHYDLNRDSRIAQAKSWQKENKEKVNLKNRHRRAKRKGSGGTHTQLELDTLMKLQGYKCVACSEDITEKSHLDHIMPISLGGANSIDNLQYLCPFCNLSKNDTHPDVWKEEIKTEEWKERRELMKS